MSASYNVIIADTSCLIILDRIGHLDLLKKIFNTITITPEIHEEYGKELPSWIRIKKVRDTERTRLLLATLDLGEASAIALASEENSPLLNY